VLEDTVKVIEGRDWSVETGEGGGRASYGCMRHLWMLVIGNFKPEVCHYLAASSKTMAKSLLHLV